MKVKALNIGEIFGNDIFQVTDRENKIHSLRYEGSEGNYVYFKLMGRNETKIFEVESNIVNSWLNDNFFDFKKVLKYAN